MSTKSELRNHLIGGKKAKIPEGELEIEGKKYLITGMTLKEFRASVEDERDYSGIHEVIEHLLDPSTREKIFDHTDVEIVKDLPAGSVGFVATVQKKMMELTVGVDEEEDPVEGPAEKKD